MVRLGEMIILVQDIDETSTCPQTKSTSSLPRLAHTAAGADDGTKAVVFVVVLHLIPHLIPKPDLDRD